jgi:MFS family permease
MSETINEHTNNLNKKSKAQSEYKKAMNGFQGGIALTLIFGFAAWGVYHAYQFLIAKIVFWFIMFCIVIFVMVAISCFIDGQAAKKIEKLEAESRQEEQEFSEIDPSKRALRAEKMFKMNQKALMRYYDMNLAQTKFLTVLGILLILLGIAIVAVSLWLYAFMNVDKILLVVGNVSGIIVDCVGALFIKMYTQNVEAAVKFHAKFAESNNLLLANSIANKIENEQLREQTLSEISKGIAIVK